MNIEIYNALIELVKQGGSLALWGVGIWLGFKLLQVLVVCSVLYLVVGLITHCIIQIHGERNKAKGLRVHLLSEEVSTRFSKELDKFSEESLGILKGMQERLDSLSKKSQRKSK